MAPRSVPSFEMLRQLAQDLIYAARVLRKSPGFTAAAIVSLAIGIGANSAMFSMADALLLRPIAAPRNGELVAVATSSKAVPFGPLSWPDYVDYRDSARSVRGLVAYQTASFGLSSSRDQLPQLVYGMLVSGNFFSALEVQPVLGRNFTAQEDSAAAPAPAVIVSHGFWKERLSNDPDVLGRRLRLNGAEFTVVGVAPPSFTGMDQYFQPALYVPLHAAALAMPNSPANLLEDRGNRWLNVTGRLAPGASVAAAKAEFAAIAAGLSKAWPQTNENRGVSVDQSLRARFASDPVDGLLAVMLVGIAALVLLIACANLANLMLARGIARNREIAIRLSIGAGRWRLIRQLLTESLLLAAAGGAAGLLVAYWAIRALALIKLPTDMPIVIAVHMDQRVLVFSVCATLVTGVLFGLMPAIRGSRTDIVTSLRGGTAVSSKPGRAFSFRDALVVAQVSVALMVLSAAGMLVRSFVASQRLDVGFRTDGVLMMSFDPSLIRMEKTRGEAFYRQLLHRVRTLPGVRSATLSHDIPLGFSGTYSPVVVDGYEMPKGQESLQVETDTVAGDYFRTMEVKLARGRAFDERDTPESPRVVIVNQRMAERYWPGRDPLGARIRLGGRTGTEATVVGIAGDVTYRSTYERRHPHMYVPFEQDYQARMTLFTAVSDGLDASAQFAAIRNEVRQLNPDVPIFEVRGFRQFYNDRVLMPPRLISQIVSGLGAIGVVLAVLGLYGVIAYMVGRRTRELGIRMAIGARQSEVAAMILKRGFALASAGVAIGLPLAYVLSKSLEQLMVSRTGGPAPVLFAVASGMLAVAAAASWIPARRAARIDPMAALRDE